MSESSGSNSSQGGGDNKKRSNNRNRRRRNNNRNRNRNKSNTGGEKPNDQNNPQKNSGRNNNRRRGPKLSGFEKVERSYLNLLEKHLESRKKYYALFHRADPRQLAKLEKSFYRTLEELRDYEDNIKPEFKEEFERKYNGLKNDYTYSENHSLDPEEMKVEVTEEQIEDPHLLPSQVEHGFNEDEEESSGSMDDYYSYKGVEPPTQESES